MEVVALPSHLSSSRIPCGHLLYRYNRVSTNSYNSLFGDGSLVLAFMTKVRRMPLQLKGCISNNTIKSRKLLEVLVGDHR